MIFLTDDKDAIDKLLAENAREEAVSYCKIKGYDEEKTEEIINDWVRNCLKDKEKS